jgi:hypothetical protein
MTLACTFHGLGSLACSESELISETVAPFRHFGRTPLTGAKGMINVLFADVNFSVTEW